jgi:multidrug resistance protein, MATE family
VVAFGDFAIMIPYGLGLGVVTLIGNTLGSN